MTANEALYPIREVSSLTGVNSITLRAWERRYGLIEPVRTEGGHRLYTLAHIETIKAAVKLTQEGVPISQVKSRIGQIKTNQSAADINGDYDYQSRLIEAVESFDLESVNQELDQAFMDISDEQLLTLLFEVSHVLTVQKSNPILIFWESQLLPRLYTRLRFSLRHMALHACKKIWVQAVSTKESPVAALLAANVLSAKGYYPVINHGVQTNKQALFEELQLMQCQGLAVVDTNQLFVEADWSDWVEAHPGLEFHYFTKHAEDLAVAKNIQAHAYAV